MRHRYKHRYKHKWIQALNAIVKLKEEIESLKLERDLAIAHDRQSYPTADAYERVCAALHKKTVRLKEKDKAVATLFGFVLECWLESKKG